MKRIQGWIGMIGLGLLAGCATPGQPETTAGQVQHIVVCWLKPDGDREAVLHTANEFAKLPGVLDVTAGYKLTSAMPMVDSSYDVGIVVTFDGESALHAAEKDPILQGIIDGPFKDNVAKSVSYNNELQNYQIGKVYTEETEAATLERRTAASKIQQNAIGGAK